MDGFSDRTDLVDLEQQTVAGLFLHCPLNTLWVGHCQVITHNLDPYIGRELRPGSPIILVKGVLNGDHCRESGEGAVDPPWGSASGRENPLWFPEMPRSPG